LARCLHRLRRAWGIESKRELPRGAVMLRWSIVFLIIALIAGALGLIRVEWMASEIAWVLFVVFLILFLVSFVLGRRSPPVT